ncbi:MAG: hypothetical protein QOG26_321 [Solirubrobacterales bacterium]|nr:hypothetical protein [Solirubrobacterales bacterium]
MSERFTEEQLDAALERLSEPGRFSEAEALVGRAAPQLQRLLAQALETGGWFGESHDAAVLKAATTPDEDQRLTSVRTLLAEEARMGMMVGVAVGWTLRDELADPEDSAKPAEHDPKGET